jgi:hypothetical protein
MKTLIIHPEDRSTDFLKPIYEHVSDAIIIHGGVGKATIKQLITEHDRIMMMGHGSPSGLFSCAKFGGDNDYSGFIIDSTMVEKLSSKECIFIWCNADQFVNKHNLKGLYSGMFISEVSEATYCGLPGTEQDQVDTSNHYFSQLLGEVINEPLQDAYDHVMTNYELLVEDNPVALYNYNRLYLKD